ncbi:hypothetical protein ACIPM2_26620 [Streptomyces sp. NPDC086081]|uniref:hypothetical protein n=1 Tax=Streptomyces sp. NPDC086081 TaxID=3365749 RepID=UPI0037FD37C6
MTRLPDRSREPVPDALWDEVAGHFDEREPSGLMLVVAPANLCNRVTRARSVA